MDGESLDKIRNRFLKQRSYVIAQSSTVAVAKNPPSSQKKSRKSTKKSKTVGVKKPVTKKPNNASADKISQKGSKTAKVMREQVVTEVLPEIETAYIGDDDDVKKIESDKLDDTTTMNKVVDTENDINKEIIQNGGDDIISDREHETVNPKQNFDDSNAVSPRSDTAKQVSQNENEVSKIDDTNVVKTNDGMTSCGISEMAASQEIIRDGDTSIPVKPSLAIEQDGRNEEVSEYEKTPVDAKTSAIRKQDGVMPIRPKTPIVNDTCEGGKAVESASKENVESPSLSIDFCQLDIPPLPQMGIRIHPMDDDAGPTPNPDKLEANLTTPNFGSQAYRSLSYAENLEQAAQLTDTLETLDNMRKNVSNLLQKLAHERQVLDNEWNKMKTLAIPSKGNELDKDPPRVDGKRRRISSV